MATIDELDEALEEYHQALGEFVKGNPEPAKGLWSHRDDVTLANPFGLPARGWEQVAATMEHASSNFRDGENVGRVGDSGVDTLTLDELLRTPSRRSWFGPAPTG
jgi:hypothetical protein